MSALTKHAKERLSQRSRMSPKELLGIVDSDKTIIIGKEDKHDRVHKLFWSIQDSMWFVVVQDWSNGDIITLLPPAKSQWKISLNTLGTAKRLAMGQPIVDSSVKMESVYVSAYYRDPENTIRHKGLGRLSGEVFGNDLVVIATNSDAMAIILERIHEKLGDNCFVVSICLRLGKKGKEVYSFNVD